jgi:hypothetical protein
MRQEEKDESGELWFTPYNPFYYLYNRLGYAGKRIYILLGFILIPLVGYQAFLFMLEFLKQIR